MNVSDSILNLLTSKTDLVRKDSVHALSFRVGEKVLPIGFQLETGDTGAYTVRR